MYFNNMVVENSDADVMAKACWDLKVLLERDYSKDSALTFIGGHYRLNTKQRNRLMRETYCDLEINATNSKLKTLDTVVGGEFAIDGFNVIITIESAMCGGEVFICQDGIIRDNAMVFSNYRIREETKMAADAVLDLLLENPPRHVTWVFDSQISGSGRLAAYIRKTMGEAGLKGESGAYQAADYRLIKLNVTTATSDTELIRQLDSIVDLPAAVINKIPQEKHKEDKSAEELFVRRGTDWYRW